MGYAIVGQRFQTWQQLLEYSLNLKGGAKIKIKRPRPHGFEIWLYTPWFKDKETLVGCYTDEYKPEEGVYDSLRKIMRILGIDYI